MRSGLLRSTSKDPFNSLLGVSDGILVLLLGDDIDDRVDDHTGPVDDVRDDVEQRVLVALVQLQIYYLIN